MIPAHAEAVRSIKSAAEGMLKPVDMLSAISQIYFLVLGAGSILYYCVIVIYTRRWNSTFSWFWAACGAVHLALYGLCPLLHAPVLLCIWTVQAAGWLAALILGAKIVCAMTRKEAGEVDYVIVLGAQVRGTKITNSLMRRLDCAYGYLMEHPQTKVVVSGGQGKDEAVTEAQAMAEYLIGRGISASRIFKEEQSASTLENLRFSMAYVRPDTAAAVVTNDFHLYRALFLGRLAGYKRLTGIAATSNPVLFLNYLVREILAVFAAYIRRLLHSEGIL